MSDIGDYDLNYDADMDEYDKDDFIDEYDSYHKEEFVRWYYGKPQLDEYDILMLNEYQMLLDY